MEELEKDIIQFIEKHNCGYKKLCKDENIKKIHDIIFNDEDEQ